MTTESDTIEFNLMFGFRFSFFFFFETTRGQMLMRQILIFFPFCLVFGPVIIISVWRSK